MSNSVRYITFIPEYMEPIFKDIVLNEKFNSCSELILTIKEKLNTTDYSELFGLNEFLSSIYKSDDLSSIFLKDIKHILELDADPKIVSLKNSINPKLEADKILNVLKVDIENFNIKDYISVMHLILPIQPEQIYTSKNTTHDFSIFVTLKNGFTNAFYNANATRKFEREKLILEEIIKSIIDIVGENSIRETTLYSTLCSK